jgi:hemicentin
VAKNPLGSVTTTVCALDVDIRPNVVPKFEAANVTADSCDFFQDEGKSAEFEFDVTGKPEPTLEYFKDEVKFKATEKRITLVKREGGCKLAIPDLKTADTGVYKITAKNSSGEKSFLINLKIKSAPKLAKTLKSKIELVEGTKLELNATLVPGVYPAADFKWFRNDEPLDETQAVDYLITRDANGSSFIVESVNLTMDQSKYKLVASNELGKCETEAQLDVLSVPKFTLPISDSQPLLNQPFEWLFEVDSNPEPKLKLFKNDKEIVLGKDARIKLTKECETTPEMRKIYKCKLVFANALGEDLGTYRLEAANKAGEAKSQAQITVKGAPCFIKKPVDTSVVIGKPFKFECEVIGIPTPELVWLKNGEPIVDSERMKVENKNKTSYWINLKACTKEDIGIYTIKLSNDSGTAECTYNFGIQTAPEIIKPLVTQQQLIEGNPCTLSCIITGNPKPAITWIKNKASIQDEVDSGRIKLEETESEHEYKLTIESCVATDGGVYIIKAKNPIGEVQSQSTLVVQTPPKFVKPLALVSSSIPATASEVSSGVEGEAAITKMTVNEKTQLKLESQITGLPKPTVKWYRGEQEIFSNDKAKIEAKQETFSITIKDCSAKEQGLYTVVAENSVGQAKSKLYLDVNNIPVLVKPLANTEVVFDETQEVNVELSCSFKSKPKAEVTWLFGDKTLKDGDNESHYSIKEDTTTDENSEEVFLSTLFISKVQLADSGSYKIKLKNTAGEISSTSVLSVLKAPVITQALPESLNLVEKKEIRLECHVLDGVPKSTVTWHKENNTLNASKRVIIGKPTLNPDNNSYVYTLTIADAGLPDAGVYSIRAANKVATVESKCTLGVLSAPRIIKDLKPTLECTENDKIHIEVTAAGKPTPEFQWSRFNPITSSDEPVVATEDGSITMQCQNDSVYSIDFSRISKDMGGKYTLKLSNPAGSCETICNIVVNGNFYLFNLCHLNKEFFREFSSR